ncbi:hypothetical protein BKA56DRAFT_636976 [Ilyonectria sp. MPI-CAGE-AT-0026]|nr:hypothetical protein BKA56DRAFT_636976 [Ilyonectria sp. MPI-CAGE-AT-0026]
MTSPPPASEQQHKHACSLCARRKVKCDKGDPCSNCLKAQAHCLYETPAPPRPRKRAADEDLLARLALYEDLMRKHKIDFTRYANTWVPSGLEAKLGESDGQVPVPICLWSDLTPELKYPLMHSLPHKDEPCLHSTLPFQLSSASTEHKLHELHPEPRQIYQLWQTFVESVNPLSKIVHVPTMQQRILDASWDLSNVPKPLTAIMFAIYTLSVTSMPSADCQECFGETRGTLLPRYRAATARALIEVGFLTTRELDVLQAFFLFLLADTESELTSTLTGAAIRLGQKMGLHRENSDSKISFFEKEMRIRLWWQLCGLDARLRAVSTPGLDPLSELGDVRLPLNVNDADLHPEMIESPVEHKGPTEMMCVLMKFEVPNWRRSSPTASKVFENLFRGHARTKISMELEDQAINELEAIYQEKYFSNWDKRIPLHSLTHTMANLAVSRMRFKIHHPRGRAVSGGEIHMTSQESQIVFDSAVTSLEMVSIGIRSKFSSQLFTHLTSNFLMDAYIYVISDLRRRCSGERVSLAWTLVEDLYNDHPEIISDDENTFFTALGDLTLEAWEARRKELVCGQGVRESNVTPQFIQLLRDKKQNKHKESDQMHSLLDPYNQNPCVSDDSDLYWEYCTDFLRF